MTSIIKFKKALFILIFLGTAFSSVAQTDLDGIMMNRKQFCNGPLYMYNSWDHYWEGKLERTNLNLGTVSTQSLSYMANYGITNNLNIMAAVPYISTKATAGTLHKDHGIQDLSMLVKWKALNYSFGKNKIALILVGGLSTPLSNYQIDYLPLSIGLGSTNIISRAMIDFKHERFTITGSAAYIWRSNIRIDRNAYFDTEMHLTDQVKMPNAMQYQLRTGYRGKYLLAEALLNNWTTLGGFDITRNNMPFPSNRMNSTSVGVALKYTIKQFIHLSVLGGADYTVAGRNVGKATSYNFGVFYAFYFRQTSSKNFSNNNSK